MPDTAYLDVISFRKRGDKAYPHKIGSAKDNGKGGYNVYLDSLPLPDEQGRVSLVISPRQESRGGYGQQSRTPQRPSRGRDDDLDQEVPF